MMKNHSVFDVFTNSFLGGAQRAPKIDFGRVWGLFESPLGTSFGHVGGSVELLGHHLGPKWSQKRQHEGLKSDLGSSRGGQGVSKALNVSILGRFSSLYVCYLVFLYVFVVRMVLCMQFGTLTWILFLMCLFSFQHGILTWLHRRIANASLNMLDVVKAAPQARPKTT